MFVLAAALAMNLENDNLSVINAPNFFHHLQ